MSVRPVTAYVQAHGLVLYRDLDHFDAAMDEQATGDPYDPEYIPPHRPLRTHFADVAGTSLPTRRGAQSSGPAARPAVLSSAGRPDRDAPGGAPSSPPLGAVVPTSETNTR